MNKPRRAKLLKVEQQKPPAQGWVATDTAGRCFIDLTKSLAVKMLEDYNAGKHSPSSKFDRTTIPSS